MIELITFDLDDTLWAVRPVIVQAEATMQRWLAEQVPDYPQRIDQNVTLQLRTELLAEQPQLRFDISALREQLLERAIQRCGIDPRRARELAAAAFEVFMVGRNTVEFFPGALTTLATLGRSYRLGALTNGNADIHRIGLQQHLEFSMSPVRAGARKPDPAIFAATLDHAGCSADRVVHVGDHLQEDIGGAAAAGWRTVWVNLTGAEPPSAPPYSATVTDLADLPATIAALSE